MSHEVETMFYAGEVPWHGLGVYSDRELGAEEACKKAGLQWEVDLRPLFVDSSLVPGTKVKSDDLYGIVRSSDDRVLGTCTQRYTPMQNLELFNFLDAIAGIDKETLFHTAGSLRGGRKVWALAKMKGFKLAPVKGDEIDLYLLGYNSHDGKSAMRVMLTAVRVVCNNTLQIALSSPQVETYFHRHVGDVTRRVEAARQVIGLAEATATSFSDLMDEYVRTPVTAEGWQKFCNLLIRGKLDKDGKPSAQTRRKRETLTALFENLPTKEGLPHIAGTKYCALQAVTALSNHNRTVRAVGGRSKSEARLDSILFGSAAGFADKAMGLLSKDFDKLPAVV